MAEIFQSYVQKCSNRLFVAKHSTFFGLFESYGKGQ